MNEHIELLKDVVEGLKRLVKQGKSESQRSLKLANELKVNKVDAELRHQQQLDLLKKIANKDVQPQVNVNPTPVNVTTNVNKSDLQAISEPFILSVKDLATKLATSVKALKINWPTSPKEPIPVRLSDGVTWLNGFGGGGSPGRTGQDYIKIEDQVPTSDRVYNPSIVISKNAAGEVVRVDETFEGVTYRFTITRSDNTISSSITISAVAEV